MKSDAADKSSANKKKQGHRLPDGWMPEQRVIDQMQGERPELDFDLEHRKFTDYWIAQPGAKGRKVDWNATWRNWIRNARVDKSRQEYKPSWQKRLEHAATQNQQYRAPSDGDVFSIGR